MIDILEQYVDFTTTKKSEVSEDQEKIETNIMKLNSEIMEQEAKFEKPVFSGPLFEKVKVDKDVILDELKS